MPAAEAKPPPPAIENVAPARQPTLQAPQTPQPLNTAAAPEAATPASPAAATAAHPPPQEQTQQDEQQRAPAKRRKLQEGLMGEGIFEMADIIRQNLAQNSEDSKRPNKRPAAAISQTDQPVLKQKQVWQGRACIS